MSSVRFDGSRSPGARILMALAASVAALSGALAGATAVRAATEIGPTLCLTSPGSICPAAAPSIVSSDGTTEGVDGAGRVFYSNGTRAIGVTNVKLAAPIVGIRGYWLVGSDGGVFTVPAPSGTTVPPQPDSFYGSMGGHVLDAPIVAMAPTADMGGYWLAGADGGVFSFGDARFRGSLAGTRLAAPIVDIESSGSGYLLVGADGGVFSFGGAPFFGSLAGRPLAAPIVGLSMTPTGTAFRGAPVGPGYWLIGKDGGLFAFGQAPFLGSFAGTDKGATVGFEPSTNVGIAGPVLTGCSEVMSTGQVYSAVQLM